MPPVQRGGRGDKWDVVYEAIGATVRLGVALAIVWYGYPVIVKHFRNALMEDDTSASEMEQNKSILAKKLKRSTLHDITLNKYEAIIANDVLERGTTKVTFDSIGGLEKQIKQIRESIVMPLRLWKMFASKGKPFNFPSGMLLYGKPGTGKTLCVQALLNETEATVISIKASTLLNKYFGESPKLVTALFNLARKLAPTIVFIDEIDTLLPKRGTSTSSEGWRGATDAVQGAFLAEWDGLQNLQQNEQQQQQQASSGCTNSSDNSNKGNDKSTVGTVSSAAPNGTVAGAPVIVVGATNRPYDLDKAILRRMPISVQMPLPDRAARKDILCRQLRDQGEVVSEIAAVRTGGSNSNTASSVKSENNDVNGTVTGSMLDELADRTEGFSGSDLRELVRVAILQRNKELMEYILKMEEQVSATVGTGSSTGAGKTSSSSLLSSAATSSIAAGTDTEDSDISTSADAASAQSIAAVAERMMNRPLCKEDFETALQQTTPTENVAVDYESELHTQEFYERKHIQERTLRNLMAAENAQQRNNRSDSGDKSGPPLGVSADDNLD